MSYTLLISGLSNSMRIQNLYLIYRLIDSRNNSKEKEQAKCVQIEWWLDTFSHSGLTAAIDEDRLIFSFPRKANPQNNHAIILVFDLFFFFRLVARVIAGHTKKLFYQAKEEREQKKIIRCACRVPKTRKKKKTFQNSLSVTGREPADFL